MSASAIPDIRKMQPEIVKLSHQAHAMRLVLEIQFVQSTAYANVGWVHAFSI